jgi:TPR repeat protein
MLNLTGTKDSNNIIINKLKLSAINGLARHYKNGKNLEKAFYLYQKAAENGNKNAMNNLAKCYKYGKGTEKNLEKHFICIKKQLKMAIRKQ